MFPRLAPLLAAVFMALGGCAQDPLVLIGALTPPDIIYDAPATSGMQPGPIPVAAGWGETTVYPGGKSFAPPPTTAWGAPTVIPVVQGPSPEGPYILDTGDRLRVFVYGQPNLSRLYIVDQSGRIAVPLIGSVRARGRTTRELEHVIKDELAREFVRDPHVTVDVAQNRPFFILGEVRLPGQYPYVSGMTVETAVAIAGGYTPRASHRRFRITRRLNNGLIDQIEAPEGYPLLPSDTVYVYERFF